MTSFRDETETIVSMGSSGGVDPLTLNLENVDDIATHKASHYLYHKDSIENEIKVISSRTLYKWTNYLI